MIAGLVAVGTAAYVFRDDIKAAFGIAAEAAEEWSIRTGDALVDTSPKFLHGSPGSKGRYRRVDQDFGEGAQRSPCARR